MRATARNHTRFGRLTVNAVAAILFVVQALSLGFAGSTMAAAVDGSFGVVCVNSAGGDASSGSSPVERHQACPCCIIHCNSAVEVDGGNIVVVVLRREPPPLAAPWSDLRIETAIDAPELRPLSPRAPPARFA